MNSYILEEMEYQNFLAEQEFLDHLSVLSIKYNGVITESNVEVVTEGVKDNIMNYIRKVIANIQRAWDRFKGTTTNKRYDEFMKKYEKYLDSDFILKINDDEFLMPNFDEMKKLIDVDFPSDLDKILDDLIDEKEFTKKYFAYVYEEGKSIKEVAESKVLSKIKNNQKTITSKDLPPYIKFLSEYKNIANELDKDMKAVNKLSKESEILLSNINIKPNTSDNKTQQTTGKTTVDTNKPATNATNNAPKNEAFYYFDEADATPKFSSGTGNNDTGNSKTENGPDLKAINKQINTYFRVCTAVITAKLSTLNKVQQISYSILKNFGLLAEKEFGDDNQENQENQDEDQNDNQNDDGATQVKL